MAGALMLPKRRGGTRAFYSLICRAMRPHFLARLPVMCASVLVLEFSTVACAPSSAAAELAYGYHRLHSFCGRPSCRDGYEPYTALLADAHRNLYGTTVIGGGVYELKPDGQKPRFRVIRSLNDTADGTLIADTSGNLYGTTGYGGKANHGTVFKLSPEEGRARWKITTLYEFCRRGGSCPDGRSPFTGLAYAGAASGQTYDGTSPLYGTTAWGGANDYGTVFELKPPKQGKVWIERVLYSFCSLQNCADGDTPSDVPIIDEAGNIYGAAVYGGKYNGGVVYELSGGLGGNSWTEAVLHSFQDYISSAGSMVMDDSGNIYGTAGGGKFGQGILFEFVRSGIRWKFLTLYNFCALRNCADGAGAGDIVMDSSGNIYGVAGKGGAANYGTAFKLIPDGSKWKLTVLYSFCGQAHCADGAIPVTVTLGRNGGLFGTTESGGDYGGNGLGVAFELRPR